MTEDSGHKKLKCPGERPNCARCVRERITCVYNPQKQMGRPRKRQRSSEDCPAAITEELSIDLRDTSETTRVAAEAETDRLGRTQDGLVHQREPLTAAQRAAQLSYRSPWFDLSMTDDLSSGNSTLPSLQPAPGLSDSSSCSPPMLHLAPELQ